MSRDEIGQYSRYTGASGVVLQTEQKLAQAPADRGRLQIALDQAVDNAARSAAMADSLHALADHFLGSVPQPVSGTAPSVNPGAPRPLLAALDEAETLVAAGLDRISAAVKRLNGL